MATLFVLLFVALLLAAAALQLMRRRVWAAALVTVGPVGIVLTLIADLSRGVQHIGQAAYNANERQLVVSLPLLALCALALWRPNWQWLFWILWLLNVLIAACAVYLTFFWKVFS